MAMWAVTQCANNIEEARLKRARERGGEAAVQAELAQMNREFIGGTVGGRVGGMIGGAIGSIVPGGTLIGAMIGTAIGTVVGMDNS